MSIASLYFFPADPQFGFFFTLRCLVKEISCENTLKLFHEFSANNEKEERNVLNW
jgi:hypothetical protein